MSMTTCERAFKQAYSEAPQCSSGREKLGEVKDRINQMASALQEIAAIVNGERGFHPDEHLGACLAFERADWLRSLPAKIATMMGRDILPAISALEHDGLPSPRAEQELVQARADAADLIHRCDLVREKLLLTVKDEYDAMRVDDSMLRRLLQDAFDIAETALPPDRCLEARE